ncbi:MAG: T9SS type A sorting domain-containing protein [Candidatus Delongbacteria bacterium]|jgi:hypothetical protein|nr:T9SS type A sorting domain-containing protein [Candidatus Delongbacteria bacterium]
MFKKITVVSLVLIFSLSMALDNVDKLKTRKMVKWNKVNDTKSSASSSSKLPYVAEFGTTFDQGFNGYGWGNRTGRRIETNMDPATGLMIGTHFRNNDLSASAAGGAIGGMIGVWDTAFLGNSSTIYGESIYQDGAVGEPGGRYVASCAFINGFYFGVFNDYDLVGPGTPPYGETSQPMFTVCDATWGYDDLLWTTDRVEATEGGAVVPDAWTGSGDVVYEQATGLYHWSQVWNSGLANGAESVWSVVNGQSLTPDVPESWIWTDYQDLGFNCTDSLTGEFEMGDLYPAFCKDIYGNGTGYGIMIGNAVQVDDSVMNSLGQTVAPNAKISYMYTTNWGAEDDGGGYSPNWISDGGQLFQIESKDLFDWFGEEIITRDSIGWDDILEETIWDTTEVIPMDDPSIQHNVSVIATEYNAVHLLIRVWAGSLNSPGSYYPLGGNDFRGGYYHVRGQISDTGVTWSKATMIAGNIDNYIDADADGDYDFEYKYYNSNSLSIGYAGFGQVYASWMDKPTSRAVANPFADLQDACLYKDDAYFSISGDDGDTWQVDYLDSVLWDTGEIWVMPVGYNLTNTGKVHEAAWAVAKNGTQETGELTLYGVSQSYDPNALTNPDNDSMMCYEQFYNIWKITGTMTNGIEAEEVSMVNDFELMQNYPNPFNPSTKISFKIQNEAKVKLTVFNSNGETVASLVNGKMAKGLHKVNFDASKLNSGVYFYQLDVSGMKTTKKMVLAK